MAANRWVRAIIIVLAIPIVAFLIGTAVNAKYHDDLVQYIQGEIGRPLTAEEAGRLDLDVICADPDMSGEDVCGDIRLAGLSRTLSIAGIVVGGALLAIVWLLSSRARRDRDALIRLFRPGLYATLGGLIVAVAIDATLAVIAVYLAIGVFTGRVFPVVLLGLGAGGLFGVYAIAQAAMNATKRGVSSTIGRRVDPMREPKLAGLVTDLAREVGTAPPDNIIVGLDANYFVTELDVQTTTARLSGRSLFLSLPLSRMLTETELRAVLGHEMGHFQGADTVYSQRFYPIYAGAVGALQNLGAAVSGSGLRLIVLYPAGLILGLFLDGFATTERAISRDRELAADAVGARVASAQDIGTSLVKIAAFVPALGTAISAMADSTRRRKPTPARLGEAFMNYAKVAALGDPFADLDTKEIPHPTDSHPPLTERLAALGLSIDGLRAGASRIEPEQSAASLVADAASLEAELTEWLHQRMEVALAGTPIPPEPVDAPVDAPAEQA